MKKLIRGIVFFVIIAAALAILKPTEKQFEEWVKEEYAVRRAKVKGENVLDKLAEKGINKATELQVLNTYSYNNLYLAASVDAHANGEEHLFFGVAGFWFQLK